MAIICRDHKLLFIMVPASGCTALGDVLQKRLGGEWFPSEDLIKNNYKIPHKHTSIQELLEYNLMTKRELSKYLKFATVRNPFDRWVTLYQRRVGEWFQTKIENKQKKLEFLVQLRTNEINKTGTNLKSPRMSKERK